MMDRPQSAADSMDTSPHPKFTSGDTNKMTFSASSLGDLYPEYDIQNPDCYWELASVADSGYSSKYSTSNSSYSTSKEFPGTDSGYSSKNPSPQMLEWGNFKPVVDHINPNLAEQDFTSMPAYRHFQQANVEEHHPQDISLRVISPIHVAPWAPVSLERHLPEISRRMHTCRPVSYRYQQASVEEHHPQDISRRMLRPIHVAPLAPVSLERHLPDMSRTMHSSDIQVTQFPQELFELRMSNISRTTGLPKMPPILSQTVPAALPPLSETDHKSPPGRERLAPMVVQNYNKHEASSNGGILSDDEALSDDDALLKHGAPMSSENYQKSHSETSRIQPISEEEHTKLSNEDDEDHEPEPSHAIYNERYEDNNGNDDSQKAEQSVGFNSPVPSGESNIESLDMGQISAEMIDNIMSSAIGQVQDLLLNYLNDYAISEATDGMERSDKRPRESSSGSSSPNSEIPQQKRLVREGQDPGDDGDESGEDDDNDHPQGNRKPHPFRRSRRLKCPFYQREPDKHSRAACRGEGFADMAKLKDHIKRVHTQPLRCARCWMEMKNEDAYISHLQAELPCGKQKQPMDDRITYQTLKRFDFKKAPYAQAKNTEGKWKILYTVLFPNDTDIPSPYEQHGFTPKLERVLHEALEEELARELAPALEPILRRIKERIPAIIQSCKLKILSASLDSTGCSDSAAWSGSPESEAPTRSKQAGSRRRKAGEMSSTDDEQEMAKKDQVLKKLKTKQPLQDRSPISTRQSTDDPFESRHTSSPDSTFDNPEKLFKTNVCEQTPPSTTTPDFPQPVASNTNSERQLQCLLGIPTSEKLNWEAQRQAKDAFAWPQAPQLEPETLNEECVQQVPGDSFSMSNAHTMSGDFDSSHLDLESFIFNQYFENG